MSSMSCEGEVSEFKISKMDKNERKLKEKIVEFIIY
jgi:hypothetical protein